MVIVAVVPCRENPLLPASSSPILPSSPSTAWRRLTVSLSLSLARLRKRLPGVPGALPLLLTTAPLECVFGLSGETSSPLSSLESALPFPMEKDAYAKEKERHFLYTVLLCTSWLSWADTSSVSLSR